MGFTPGTPGSSSSLAGSPDVAISGVQSGQLLAYDQPANKWQNKTVATGGGGVNDPQVHVMPPAEWK